MRSQEQIDRLNNPMTREEVRSRENREKFKKGLATVGIIAGVLAGSVGAISALKEMHYNQEVRSEEVSRQTGIEQYTAEGEFMINGGANLREAPVPMSGEDSNVVMRLGKNDGAKYEVVLKEGAVVDIKSLDSDPNGKWLGLEAEDIESAPKDLMKAIEKDATGKIWTNIDQNVEGLNLGEKVEQDK